MFVNIRGNNCKALDSMYIGLLINNKNIDGP